MHITHQQTFLHLSLKDELIQSRNKIVVQNIQIKQLEYEIDHLKTTQVNGKGIDDISAVRQIVEELQKFTSDHHQQQQHDISSNIILTHKVQ